MKWKCSWKIKIKSVNKTEVKTTQINIIGHLLTHEYFKDMIQKSKV